MKRSRAVLTLMIPAAPKPCITRAKASMGSDVAKARIARGFRFVTVSSDARLMAAGAQQILKTMHASTGTGAPTSGAY